MLPAHDNQGHWYLRKAIFHRLFNTTVEIPCIYGAFQSDSESLLVQPVKLEPKLGENSMNLRRTFTRQGIATIAAAFLIQPAPVLASSHREAPITALDQKADITDWYAFVSPEKPDHVVLIMNVDPFLEPSNGPNYFPFDPGILYEMKIDNNHDGIPDVTFQVRFKTEITQPGIFTGYVGGLAGIPPITSLTGPGATGLNLKQTYTVTMKTPTLTEDLGGGQSLIAVPANVGPRTMPNYAALRQQGTYTLSNNIRVFAGTVADPFFIDLGRGLRFAQLPPGGGRRRAERGAGRRRYAQLRAQCPLRLRLQHHRSRSADFAVDLRQQDSRRLG